MLKKFEIPLTDDSINEMFVVKYEMESFLMELHNNKIPNDHYGKKDLFETVRELVRSQREDLPQHFNKSWTLARKCLDMPSEARVDFAYEPTYIVVAILTWVKIHYPQISEAVDNFDRTLKNGMYFSTLRDLRGHGYEAEDGTIRAVHYLYLGDVPTFLAEDKFFEISLYLLLKKIFNYVVNRLALNNTKAGWDKDYREEYEQVAKELKALAN